MASKKKELCGSRRAWLTLLRHAFGEVVDTCACVKTASGVLRSIDILDALACVWTAARAGTRRGGSAFQADPAKRPVRSEDGDGHLSAERPYDW